MKNLTPSQKAGLRHCGNAEQLLVKVRHLMNGTCPFCGGLQPGDTPWLLTTNFWHIKENRWPDEHTKAHLIAAPFGHVTRLGQVTSEMWAEMSLVIAFVEAHYGPMHGGIAGRAGSLEYSAGTEEHFHLNFIYPDLTGQVRITLAKEVSGPEVERRERRFQEFLYKLPDEELKFLAERGIGLSSLLVNEIHDPE